MKYLLRFFILNVLLVLGMNVNAQTIVDTAAQNKKVVLEVYRGATTPFGGFADHIADTLKAKNPTVFTIINSYEGSFAGPRTSGPYYYPDYRTSFGPAIQSQAGIQGWPTGSVNRSLFPAMGITTNTAMARNQWQHARDTILNQPSPVNVGVIASYNSNTKVITATVEVYFTDTISDSLFINVGFKQNNIYGPQNGDTANYPARYGANIGIYRHDNVLRHLVTGQWGEHLDSINYIKGTLWTRTYTWSVPDSVGEVPVVASDLDVFAFVSGVREPIITGVGSQVNVPNIPLSGTYTIGGTSPDYATISAAVSDLISKGVNAQVIFNIRQGTYNEQVLLDSILGASATNTITFQSDPANTTKPVITFSAISGSAPATIELDGADYITFKNLEIRATGSSYADVFRYQNYTDHIIIDSCTIVGIQGNANAINHGTGSTDKANHCIVRNSEIINGYYGIYAWGDTPNREVGNQVVNCRFINPVALGAQFYTQDSLLISGNTVEFDTATIAQKGIKVVSSLNSHIIGNRITLASTGATEGIWASLTSFSSAHCQISNNVIRNKLSSSASEEGIVINTYGADVNFNTVHITSTNTTNGSCIQISGAGNTNLRNNNFVNTGGGRAITFPTTGTSFTSDYNNLYVTGDHVGLYNNSNKSDLQTWIWTTTFDSNSVSINPLFLTNDSLVPNNGFLNDLGTPISGITTDINQTTRNTTNPDIGAYEFNGVLPPMAGIYTVGGTTPDYSTVLAAVSALNSRGVSDTVKFLIRQGTYTDQIIVDSIVGASASQWVKFTSDPANTTDVIVADNSNDYTWKFNGTDYVTIDGISIKNTGQGHGIFMRGLCNYLAFTNNDIEVTRVSNQYNGAIYDSSGIASLSHNITISGNTITGGFQGVYAYGETFGDYQLNWDISNNNISNYGSSGIWVTRISHSKCIANRIIGQPNVVGSYTGITFQHSIKSRIEQNNLKCYESMGIEVTDNSTDDSLKCMVTNNVVYSPLGTTFNSTSSPLAISGTNTEVAFNTVSFTNSQYSNGVQIVSYGGANVKFRNNIVVNRDTGAVVRYIQNSLPTFSNNLYYSKGDSLGVVLDSTSFNMNPRFLADTLLIPGISELESAGTPITAITKDILDVTRSTTSPSIGAYEFTYVCNGLSGTYTIGGTSPDYATISSAVADLNNKGICDDVTFNIRQGTYIERITVNEIYNAGDSGMVIFQSDPANTAEVILQDSLDNISLFYYWLLDGATHLKFKGLTFNNKNNVPFQGGANVGIVKLKDVEDIEFDDCTFSLIGSLSAIYQLDSGSIKNLSVKNCDFIGGSDGLNLQGSTGDTNLVIENCNFTQFRFNGVYVASFDSVRMSNNYVRRLGLNSYGQALLMQGVTNANVYNNKFYFDADNSQSISFEGVGSSSGEFKFYNNQIAGIGLQVKAGGTNLDFHHNSISGSSPNYVAELAIFSSRFQNNQVVNQDTGRAVYFFSGSGPIYSNNNFFTKGDTLAQVAAVKYVDLASLSGTGFDSLSVSIDPRFKNDSILIPRVPDLESAGTPLAGITTDIRDSLRSTTAPSIGAYEYTYVCDGLSGTYTIGGTSPDYATISEAVADLNNNGICDDVIFNIAPGNYGGQHWFNEIYNAGDSGIVTFQKDPGKTGTVIIGDTLNTTEIIGSLFTFDNSGFVTFKNIEFNSYDNAAFVFVNDVEHLTIDSCVLKTGNVFDGRDSQNDDEHLASYIKLTNSKIKAIGEINRGSSWRSRVNHSWELSNNDITAWGIGSPGYSRVDSFIIINNKIDAADFVAFSGTNIEFAKNRVTVSSGYYTKGIWSGWLNKARIYNNSFDIYCTSKSYRAEGIHINSTDTVHIYNNTFKIGHKFEGVENSGIHLADRWPFVAYVSNNNISLESSGYAWRLTGDGSNPGEKFFSNNNLHVLEDTLAVKDYTTGTFTAFTSISALNVAGFDSNSVSVNPNFVSDTLLKPNSPLLDSGGVTLPGISKDINDVVRTSPPDIGAYEFQFVPLASSIAADDSAKCFGDSIMLFASANFSSDYEWLLNGDSTGKTGDTIFVTQSGSYQAVANFGSLVDTSNTLNVVVSDPSLDIVVTDSNFCAYDSAWSIEAMAIGGIHGTRVGPADTNIAGLSSGLHIASTVHFDVLQNNLRLDAVSIYPENVGQYSIYVYNNSNSAIDSVRFNVTHTKINRVVLGFDLPLDTGYSLRLEPNTARFQRTTDYPSNIYPLTDDKGFVRVTRNDQGNPGLTKWYTFYNWELSKPNKYAYLWAGSQTTASLSNLGEGTYMVTTTDSLGCIASQTLTLTNPSEISSSAVITTEKCRGSFDGNIVLTASGDYSPFNYAWSNSDSTATISNLATGEYLVTIFDAKGCSQIDTFDVGIESNVVLGFITKNVSCFGFTDGNINMAVAGGKTPYVFNWSNSSTQQDPVGLAAGKYKVTVTDSLSCIYTDSVVITQPPTAPQIVGSSTQDTICLGDSITLSGTGGVTYAWNNGAVEGVKFVPAQTRNYIVTGKDTNSCFGKDTVRIVVDSLPAVGLQADFDLCTNEGTYLVGTQRVSYMYAWSDASTNDSLWIDTAGTYSLMITDANGCINLDSVIVSPDSIPLPNLPVDDSICAGGSFALSAVANSSYTYNWSNSESTSTINITDSGNYAVVVTDLNNCSNYDTFHLSVIALPVVTWASGIPALCDNDLPDTLKEGLPSGGAFVGTYSGSGIANNIIQPRLLTPGNYPVRYTVVDTSNKLNCSNYRDTSVTVRPLPNVKLSAISPICMNGGVDTITEHSPKTLTTGRFFGSAGIIEDSIGIFDPMVNGAGMDTIYYRYTDINGCSDTASRTITVKDSTFISFASSLQFCVNDTFVILTEADSVPSGKYGSYSGKGVVNGKKYWPQQAGYGFDTLTYAYTNIKGCRSTNFRVIQVDSLPIVGLFVDDTCRNAAPLVLTGGTPSGGTYYNNVQGNISGDSLKPGLYAAGLQNMNYWYEHPTTGCRDSVSTQMTIFAKPIVRFALPDSSIENCIDAIPVPLSGYSPIGGYFTGRGLNPAGNKFLADSAGVGTHRLVYHYENVNHCRDSVADTVIVHGLPVVSLNYLDSVCSNALPDTIKGGLPLGGVYSGFGVSASGIFSASLVGKGAGKTITYTYTDSNSCVNSATQVFKVDTVTPISMTLIPSICVNAPMDTLKQASINSGNFIYKSRGSVSNNVYNPQLAGVGLDTVTYVYTNLFGCQDSIIETRKVDSVTTTTVIVPTNRQEVCNNSNSFALTFGYPVGGYFSPGQGIVNNNFTPSQAKIGPNNIIYTFTNAFGCVDVDTGQIVVNASPVVSMVGDTICLNNGQVVMNSGKPAIGGTGRYAGKGMINDTLFDPLFANIGNNLITYSFTDTNNCSNSSSGNMRVNSLPIVNFVQPLPVCGNIDTFKLAGGSTTGLKKYYKGAGVIDSTGSYVASIVGKGKDTLTFVGINPTTGCMDSVVKILVVDSVPLVSIDTIADLCEGAATFTLNQGKPKTSGSGTYSGPGVLSGRFFPSLAGIGSHDIIYRFTNLKGCSNADTTELTISPKPIMGAATLPSYCVHQMADTLKGALPLGGKYTGLFVDTLGLFSPDSVGSWKITYSFTDSNNCSNSIDQFATVRALPNVGLVFDSSVCINAGNLLLQSGTPRDSRGKYKGQGVHNGFYVPDSVVGGRDTLWYVYTDQYGCIDSAGQSIRIDSLTPISISGIPFICTSQDPIDLKPYAVPKGGKFSGTSIINNSFYPRLLSPGSYFYNYVHTDSNGCVNTYSDTLSVRPLPVVQLSADTAICDGFSAVLVAGGGVSYKWDNGDYRKLRTVAPKVTTAYSVTVTNQYNCSSNASVRVSVQDQIQVFSTSSPASCGKDDGAGFVTVNRGKPPYNYYWSNGERTSTVRGLKSGVYQVTVQDANRCQQLGIVNISDKDGPAITINQTVNNNCFGDKKGSIQASATGGTGALKYFWTSGQKTASISGLPAGRYDLKVVDEKGCNGVKSVTIFQSAEIKVRSEVQEPACNTTNGQISVLTSGGAGGFTYKWSPGGGASDTLKNIGAGLYHLVVTDSKSCTDTFTYNLSTQNAPQVRLDSISLANCGAADGAIFIAEVGHVDTYLWSNSDTTQDLLNASAGLYTLTASDSLGCQSIQTYELLTRGPKEIRICYVTGDHASGYTKVVWDSTGMTSTSKVNVYRESSSQGSFFKLLTTPATNSPYYMDTSFDNSTLIGNYRVTSENQCGTESEAQVNHLAILASAKKLTDQVVQVNWSKYSGLPIAQYYIYRHSTSQGTELLDSVVSTNTTYIDYNSPLQDEVLYYYISARNASTCAGSEALINSNLTRDLGRKTVGFSEPVVSNYSVKVWPNPNAGEFNLELKGRSTSALLIRIFDNRGQIHYEKSIEELNETLVYSLKMLDISSGIYYLQVVDSKEVSTQQIIVNR